jgi:hypothetical protein
MKENKPEIWARHQRELAEIQMKVPPMKDLEPEKILHFSTISNLVKQRSGHYLPISSSKRLIYWAGERSLEKCVYDKSTDEFNVKEMNYPGKLQRLEDCIYGIWFAGMFGSITYMMGSVAENEGLIKWDFNSPFPWILIGGIATLAFTTTIKTRDEERKFSTNLKVKELNIDREAWKIYRDSPYGRKF